MSALMIETAVKISLVPAAAAIVNGLWFRRKSAASRHLVWTLAVVALLTLPILAAGLPRFELPIRADIDGISGDVLWRTAAPAADRREGQVQRDDSSREGSSAISKSHAYEPPPEALRHDQGRPEAGRRTTGSGGVENIDIPRATVLPAVYAVGVLFLLTRLVWQRMAVTRLMRQAQEVTAPDWTRLLRDCAREIGVRRAVVLLRSHERTMPMAAGTWKPAILIPAVADTWSHQRRRAVLLHELAHVARGDCLTQLLAAAACAVYWIHPGVWWIARRLRVERELACDDRVLALGTGAREYAGQLLDLAYALGGHRAPALAVSMARRQQLEGRMLAVLDGARNRSTPRLADRLSGVAITMTALIPLATAGIAIVPARAVAETAPPGTLVQADSGAKAIVADGLPGTWAIRPSSSGAVQLTLSESSHSSHGLTIPIEQLEGLSASLLTSAAGGRVQFTIRRDAGTLAFDGAARSGVGAGTYTFSPSSTFPVELTKRGFARPTPADQYLLARDNIGFAFLDELTAQGYAKPALDQLVRAAEHGINLDYLREMGRIGYRVGQVEALIKLADHGVSPRYVRELGAQGLSSLSADDLVRARDHGIDPEYIRELRTLGYGQLSLETLLHARDHGISRQYVREMRDRGHRLTLDELVKARDHGVGAEYIQELAALGYQPLSLEGLIRSRDHGITADFVRSLRELGYRATLDELIKARDHGVNVDEVRAYRALGYHGLSLEELIRLRDHGVTPEYVTQLKDHGHASPAVDDLVRLRDQGVTPDDVSHGRELLRDGDRTLRDMTSNLRAMVRTFVERWAK